MVGEGRPEGRITGAGGVLSPPGSVGLGRGMGAGGTTGGGTTLFVSIGVIPARTLPTVTPDCTLDPSVTGGGLPGRLTSGGGVAGGATGGMTVGGRLTTGGATGGMTVGGRLTTGGAVGGVGRAGGAPNGVCPGYKPLSHSCLV